MLFLLAGPGETQIFFSRAGDEPQQVEIPLGCSTWFNEPVFLVSIDTPACEIYWGDLERWVIPGPQGAPEMPPK